MLVLLNGPPASGKSTIAARLVDRRPLALNLDIDVIRGQLGRWLDQPSDAGFAARALASSMIETHLAAGHDVVVPQFLARVDFIDELSILAARCDAPFVEIALVIDRAIAVAAFAERSRQPLDSTHRHAASLVAQSDSADPIGDMYDRYVELLGRRPSARTVEVARGDIENTVAHVEAQIAAAVSAR